MGNKHTTMPNVKPTTSILTLLRCGVRLTFGETHLQRVSSLTGWQVGVWLGSTLVARYEMSREGLADALAYRRTLEPERGVMSGLTAGWTVKA